MILRALLVASALIAVPAAARAIDCSGDSTGLVPLIDLGPGLYHGFEGGLYPGGTNHRPASHQAAGAAIAASIVPLDTLGQPDAVNGRIVLVSIGMSNCTQEFRRFVPKAMGDPARNPRLLVIDCAVGGQTARIVRNPVSAYWDTVAARLRAHGSSRAQVQAVWIKEANAQPSGGFPASTDTLLWDLGGVVRTVKDELPNTKLAYFTSRIYAGYATTTLNPEPYAYESGFAVKWLIEAQIAGEDSLNFDPGAGDVHAPWIAWGPYLWADGLEPRSDGFTWACLAFDPDGTHPGTIGENIVSDSLLVFFKDDDTTAPWFLNTTTSAAVAQPSLALRATPNPSLGAVALAVSVPAGSAWHLSVFNAAGRRVCDLGSGVGPASLRWDGRGTVPGIYWARLEWAGQVVSTRIVR